MSQISDHKVGRFDRSFSIIISILLILSCGPFFILGGSSTIINLFFFIIFLFMFILVIQKRKISGINISNYNILIASLVFFLVLFLPFRMYDRFVAVVIWAITFLLFLLLEKKYLNYVSYTFANIVFYIAFFVIVIWFLLVLGINLPFWEYDTGLVGVSKSTFLIYPGTAVLRGQDFILLGQNVYRMSGIFAEPGHYGIICFFAYLLGKDLSRFKKVTIVIGSLLSFSMGTFIFWFGYLLISNKASVIKKMGVIICVIICVSLLFMFLPQEVLDRFFLDKLQTGGTLDNRTDSNFISFYRRDHDFIYHIFGYGRLLFEEFNLSNSDYRGYYIRYGLIAVSMYFLWVLSLFTNGLRKNFLLLFFVAVVIFLHRSWFIDYFILYFVLYYISQKEKL